MGTKQRIREYCKNSTIHGLQYITEENRHWTERLFWAIAVAASLWCAVYIAMSSYREFRDHSVSFVVDTNYLNWNTSFPAFTVCEDSDKDKVWELFFDQYPKGTPMILQKILMELIYYEGSCNTCVMSCNKTIDGVRLDCSVAFRKETFEILYKCEDIFMECLWNDQPFNCCSNFKSMTHERGNCYTISSLQTGPNPHKIEMISNQTTGPGKLTLRTFAKVWIYMHSSTDVVTRSMETARRWQVKEWSHNITVTFRITEIYNDPRLPTVPIDKRGCRFNYEKPDFYTTYDYYSYGSCLLQCRIDKALEWCNCVPHSWHPAVTSINVSSCDLNGIFCLEEYSYKLMRLKSRKEHEQEMLNPDAKMPDEAIYCNCNADCDEPDYFILNIDKKIDDDMDYSETTFVLESLPTERLRRNVVRTKLDLVVSLGGTAGLFLGASLISIVELFVHAFIRVCKKHKHKEQPSEQPKPQQPRHKTQVSYIDTEFNKKLPYYERDMVSLF